jgi:hypothetical protein
MSFNIEAEKYARPKLREAEEFMATLEKPMRATAALYMIGNASVCMITWDAAEVSRAVRVMEEVIRFGEPLTYISIALVDGQHSNLGDACAARIVQEMSIAPNVFAEYTHLINSIGPETLRALLRKGADPNGSTGRSSPLAKLMASHRPTRLHGKEIEMAAMLMEAGADPTNVEPFPSDREKFQQLCALRSLSAFCVSGRASGPSAWFLRRDGDLAVAHRVHTFLAARELFVPH